MKWAKRHGLGFGRWRRQALVALVALILTITIIVKSCRSTKIPTSQHKYQYEMDAPFYEGCAVLDEHVKQDRANAAFVMLARNSELNGVIASLKSLELHFNQWFHYPFVFLNDEPFSDEFKTAVSEVFSGKAEFGVLDTQIWDFPDDVEDSIELQEWIQSQGDRGIMYGSMKSYHKMCRFYSGMFYKHPLVAKYEWYWRVEPDVHFFCDLTYDPFIEMEKAGKKYGFTIMIREFYQTIPNLLRITSSFLKENKIEPKSLWKLFIKDYRQDLEIQDLDHWNKYYRYLDDEDKITERMSDNLIIKNLHEEMERNKDIKSDKMIEEFDIERLIETRVNRRTSLPPLQRDSIDGETYNLNHFWSNFEIAKIEVWSNPIYESYFKYLEDNKGFFKERWGDAPIHSIALGFLLELDELHYFRDIGYKHTTIGHCPVNHPNQNSGAGTHLDKLFGIDKPQKYGVGCHCKCPDNHKEIEDSGSDFLKDFYTLVSDDYEPKEKININALEEVLAQEFEEHFKSRGK